MSPPPPTPRASLWEGLQALLLAVNLAWTTLCLGGYRPETMIVTGGLTCALVAVHLGSRALNPGPRAHPAGWLLLPFLAYAAINARWITPVHWLGWRDWMGWAQLIAVFWVVLNGLRSRRMRRAVFGVLVALGVIAVALACYQRFVAPDWLMLGRHQVETFLPRASGPFGSPNSLAAFLLLLIPPVGALAWRAGRPLGPRLGWSLIGGVLILGLVLTISRGAWLGLTIALFGWPLALSRWNWRRRIGVAAGVLVAVAIAGAGLMAVSASIRDRLVQFVQDSGETTRQILWRAAAHIWREHPVAGSGAGSFNVVFEPYRPAGFLNDPQWAHNDYLNTLSDYGAVGFLLFFGAVAVIAWNSARPGHRRRIQDDDTFDAPGMSAAVAVGLFAFACQLFVDFHFKIPALAIAFATLSGLVVQRRWPRHAAPVPVAPSVRGVLGVGAVAVAGFAVAFLIPHYRAEALRYDSRQLTDRLANSTVEPAVNRALLTRVRSQLARAVELDPSNALAWADKACADSLWAHVEPGETVALGVSAEAAANQALALAPICSEFWLRRGVARDMQNRWTEAGQDFSRALALTPSTALTWYYYAYHLSLRKNQRDIAEGAVSFCLRLDPGNRPGLALRHLLAISPKAP
jgi:O-antigen ligase